MARILTGIQSTGRPHLGNILGAIRPAIELSKDKKNESFFFIADLHSLTTIKDRTTRIDFVRRVAATWLAFGFDTERNVFYRQSRIPEVCELTWHLNCFTPFPMLANAHSFKDKSENLAVVNAGLFTYPVLMTCDILLYDAQYVPVGKDQKQHLEMARDIASSFNHQFGETFVVPEAVINEKVMTIPGIDGRKMSKSYDNYIDIFLEEKTLKKKINTIVTDSTALEEPKNPDTCIVYQLYSLLGSQEQSEELRKKYMAGGFGYGHAKKELLGLILDTFDEERKLFKSLMDHPEQIEKALRKGEDKAREVALKRLNSVREKLGYS